MVITDGVDTRSRMAPAEVAAAASEIDVPVYILAVVSSVDDPRENVGEQQTAVASNLQELARGTGGECSSPALRRTPASRFAKSLANCVIVRARVRSVLTRRLAATSDSRPEGQLTVRARSGYSGGEPSSDFENSAVSTAPADQPPSGRPGRS